MDAIVDLLAEIAGARGVSIASVALNWLLAKPAVTSVLVGARDEEQLDQNLDVLEGGPLSQEEDAWVRQYGREVKARKKLPYLP